MPPKRRAPAKAKAKAAATQPADGLSVGGAAVVAEAGSPYGARCGPAWRSAALVARPEAQVRPSLRRFVPGATAERSSLVLYP